MRRVLTTAAAVAIAAAVLLAPHSDGKKDDGKDWEKTHAPVVAAAGLHR